MFRESTLSRADLVDRAAFVAEARSWVGVSFAHQGRSRQGVDCVGLVFCASWNLHLTLEDFRAYSARPDGVSMKQHCDRLLCPIALDSFSLADVLLFRNMANQPQHVAIIGDHPNGGWTMIHAWQPNGRVCEQGLDKRWMRFAVAAYHVGGVEWQS